MRGEGKNRGARSCRSSRAARDPRCRDSAHSIPCEAYRYQPGVPVEQVCRLADELPITSRWGFGQKLSLVEEILKMDEPCISNPKSEISDWTLWTTHPRRVQF